MYGTFNNFINRAREFLNSGFGSGGHNAESPNFSGVIFYWILSGEEPALNKRGIWRSDGVWSSTSVWLG